MMLGSEWSYAVLDRFFISNGRGTGWGPPRIVRVKWLHPPLRFCVELSIWHVVTRPGGVCVIILPLHFVFTLFCLSVCSLSLVFTFIDCPETLGYIFSHAQWLLLSLTPLLILFSYLFIFVLFWDKVSLYIPGWPETSIDHSGPELMVICLPLPPGC